jgi:tetratricopeptide (TPR) repeat protein
MAMTPPPNKPVTAPRPWLHAALVILVVSSIACASRLGNLDDATITPDELLAGTSLGLENATPEVIVDEQEVLALSAEMQDFLDTHVDRNGTVSVRLHQLVSAVIDSGTFGLEYEDTTRTASETFDLRRGNCLSFSNMFVALARDVGLKVQYQEVDVPPDWTLDNDTFVLSRHINIFVDLGLAGTRVVDFNIGDFRTSYDMRRISDARALAHFYNNMGVERLQVGDTAAALSFFRKAIADNDRLFSPAWTNLGTLYGRNGLLVHAEATYLQALKARKWDLVAMSNLARLYERRGDEERAADYRKKVFHHRMRNPYYRYNLAREALAEGDVGTAIDHFKFAVRKRPIEDQFCFQLGLAYLRKGDEKAAQRWFARARELAATDALKNRYSGKIEALLRRSESNRP